MLKDRPEAREFPGPRVRKAILALLEAKAPLGFRDLRECKDRREARDPPEVKARPAIKVRLERRGQLGLRVRPEVKAQPEMLGPREPKARPEPKGLQEAKVMSDPRVLKARRVVKEWPAQPEVRGQPGRHLLFLGLRDLRGLRVRVQIFPYQMKERY